MEINNVHHLPVHRNHKRKVETIPVTDRVDVDVHVVADRLLIFAIVDGRNIIYFGSRPIDHT